MSISSLFGGGGDDEPAPPRATISPLKNGFLFDPDMGGRGFLEASACATPAELGDAVRAWAEGLSKPKPAVVKTARKKPAR